MDNKKIDKNELPTTRLTLSYFFAPKLLDIAEPAPMPTVWAIATINI